MKFEEMTSEEMQEYVLEYGWKGFRKLTGFSDKKLKELRDAETIALPTDYVRNMKLRDLFQILAKEGSWAKAADRLSVSASFFKKVLKGKNPVKDEIPIDGWSASDLVEELRMYGSVRMVARINHIRESSVRSLAKKLDVDISKYVEFDKGMNENAKGRRGELAWKKIRGKYILRDMNEDEGSQSDYDFEDKFMNSVNVKSSKPYTTKKGQSWKFSLSSIEKCENVVFCAMDKEFNNIQWWFCIRSSVLLQKGVMSISIKESVISHITETRRGNRITYKALIEHTSLKE